MVGPPQNPTQHPPPHPHPLPHPASSFINSVQLHYWHDCLSEKNISKEVLKKRRRKFSHLPPERRKSRPLFSLLDTIDLGNVGLKFKVAFKICIPSSVLFSLFQGLSNIRACMCILKRRTNLSSVTGFVRHHYIFIDLHRETI